MAAADTTPPALTSLTFPGQIDTSANSAPFPTFSAGAADGGVGVDHVTITLDRSRFAYDGGNTITIGGSRALFAEGPQGQAVYFDQSSGSGTYTVTHVAVTDRAGNVADYSTAQLSALGLATSFTVASPAAADTTPPTLTSLSLPGGIDVTQGGATVTVLANARDAGAGTYAVQLTIDHGVGNVTLYQNGDAFNGSFTLYSNAQPGTYHVTAATVTDRQGNSRSYTAEQLAALGTATSFPVQSNAAPDVTAPVLTSFSLPATIDVTSGGLAVPVQATITETGSGVARIAIALDHPITIDYPTSYASHSNTPTGGPALSGTIAGATAGSEVYGAPLTLTQTGDTYALNYNGAYGGPNGVPVSARTSDGTYHVTGVTVTDKAGNVSQYDAAALAAMGANTSFHVNADGSAPVLTSFSLSPVVTRGGSLTVSVGATDTGTGPMQAVLNTSYAFAPFYNGGYDANHLLVSGFSNGAASFSTTISSAVPTGVVAINDLVLMDGAGNSTLYTADQLRALGYATSFRVAGATAGDFDGNGLSDLLWRKAGGAISTWSSDTTGGDHITRDTYDANVAASWHPVETFNWDADGRADILWRNDTGAVAIWTGTAGSFTQTAYLDTSVPTSWHVAAAADVNGDGAGDILWRNDDGSLSTWLGAGTGFAKNAWSHGPVDRGWTVEGLGDFNGDGKADILWRNDTGAVSVWNATGTGFQEAGSLLTAPVDRAWHVAGIGDFNGDGYDDILWRNDNGQVTVWQGNGSGFDQRRFEASAPTDWHVAAVGDYDGDRRADILWRNDAGAISIWSSTGSDWHQNTYFDASVGNDWTLIGHAFPF